MKIFQHSEVPDQQSGEHWINLGFQGNVFLQMQGLVAALGGALSLYLGIAIAMVFEFLELFIEIILVLIKHKK